MPISDLSISAQNYIKVIWALTEWSDTPVTASALAEATGLKISSVSGTVSKLEAQGLVSHARYGAVSLTPQGENFALMMIRRHRLLETFLYTHLNLTWDQVHDEAEHLEHAVSTFLIDRIDEVLGYPNRDPHGDPIPNKDGVIERVDAIQLSDVTPGAEVVVERISDSDPELLRYLSNAHIDVGTRIHISAGPKFSDTLVAQADGHDAVTLGRSATDLMWVTQ